MVFVIIASFCLSQDILYLSKLKKEVLKVSVANNGSLTNKNKNIDDLFINFLLR
tara:strand:+ start:823 stop:984 length:162 start_codon:yes stop_codon:yes gene_type:complete